MHLERAQICVPIALHKKGPRIQPRCLQANQTIPPSTPPIVQVHSQPKRVTRCKKSTSRNCGCAIQLHLEVIDLTVSRATTRRVRNWPKSVSMKERPARVEFYSSNSSPRDKTEFETVVGNEDGRERAVGRTTLELVSAHFASPHLAAAAASAAR